MKLENQVCAKKYGEKLDELGVKADSYFLRRSSTGEVFAVSNMTGLEDVQDGLFYPAYTVAELLNETKELQPILEYDGMYWEFFVADSDLRGIDENPANAIAKLIIARNEEL
jgi:hypothetical protein